jgi:hypothetical protein
MEDEAEAIAFLQFKLREVEKVTKRQEEEIAYLKEELAFLNRKLTEALERNIEVAKEKLKVDREKEKKRRDSLARVQKEEREQTRLRTKKRIAELRLEHLKWEDKEAEQLPH